MNNLSNSSYTQTVAFLGDIYKKNASERKPRAEMTSIKNVIYYVYNLNYLLHLLVYVKTLKTFPSAYHC